MSDIHPSGWYQDPTGQGEARFWNGTSWTESVNRGGIVLNVVIDPAHAQLPPVPGTQVSVPPPPSPSNVQATSNGSSGSFLAVLAGVVVVILLGVLMYAVFSGDSDDTPTTPPAPTEPAPAPEPTEAPSDG